MNGIVNHNIDTGELTGSQILKDKLRKNILFSDRVFKILEQDAFFMEQLINNRSIGENLAFVNDNSDVAKGYGSGFFEPFFLKYDNKLGELNSVMHVINHGLYVGAISAGAIFKVLSNPEIVKSKQEQISIIRILRSYLIESSEKTIFSCTRKYLEDGIRSFMEKNEIFKQELEEDKDKSQKLDNKNINNFIFEVAKSILERIITDLVNNEENALYIKIWVTKYGDDLIKDISTWIFRVFKQVGIEDENLNNDFNKYYNIVKEDYLKYEKIFKAKLIIIRQKFFGKLFGTKQLAGMLEPLIDAFMHPNDKVARIRILDLINDAGKDNYKYIIRIGKRVLGDYWFSELIGPYLYKNDERIEDKFAFIAFGKK